MSEELTKRVELLEKQKDAIWYDFNKLRDKFHRFSEFANSKLDALEREARENNPGLGDL